MSLLCRLCFSVLVTLPCPRCVKKGASRFWKDKQLRIALPWIVGVLHLTPPVVYMTQFGGSLSGSFAHFRIGDFWGAFYQQLHYWFLGILLVFYLILLGLCKVSPQFMVKKGGGNKTGHGLAGWISPVYDAGRSGYELRLSPGLLV